MGHMPAVNADRAAITPSGSENGKPVGRLVFRLHYVFQVRNDIFGARIHVCRYRLRLVPVCERMRIPFGKTPGTPLHRGIRRAL